MGLTLATMACLPSARDADDIIRADEAVNSVMLPVRRCYIYTHTLYIYIYTHTYIYIFTPRAHLCYDCVPSISTRRR